MYSLQEKKEKKTEADIVKKKIKLKKGGDEKV